VHTDWDERYRNRSGSDLTGPRDWLTAHADILPAGGQAFEAATGDGGNLPYLHEHGFRVLAADYSFEAVRLAKQRCPEAAVIRVDLSRYRLPENTFDLICNFYYLEWSLIDQFERAVRPGGLVILETMDIGMLAIKPDIAPAFLLQPGQLSAYFKNWDILDERQGWFETDGGRRKSIGSIVARRR
jgi:SAM-dependent methyltransferase